MNLFVQLFKQTLGFAYGREDGYECVHGAGCLNGVQAEASLLVSLGILQQLLNRQCDLLDVALHFFQGGWGLKEGGRAISRRRGRIRRGSCRPWGGASGGCGGGCV